MNILYYFEPWVELGRPHLRYHNLRYQLGPQIRAIKRENPNADVRIVIGEGTQHKCVTDRYDYEGCDVTVLPARELLTLFPDYRSAANALYCGDSAATRAYGDYLAAKLNGFVPDAVVSFLAPLPDLRRIWPNSITVYAEFGIFSRAPYPRTFYFDPQGMFDRSSISRHATELLESTIDDSDVALLREFREQYIRPFYAERQILDTELATHASRFKYKLLLPLQFSQYFGFDCCADYPDQFEFLIDVLSHVPSDIGVFVSEHSGWPAVITEHNIEYLRDRFPNLLWAPRLSQIRAASQYLLNEVDGVISVSSSVGLQALLWDLPIYSPWRSHLSPYSQVTHLREITAEKIESYRPGTYDAAALSMLTRYYMTEEFAYDGKRFVEFLQHAIDNPEARTFKERFPALGSTAEVFASLQAAFRARDGHRLYLEDLGEMATTVATRHNDLLPEGFRQAIDAVDTVSFDMFDTLIDRPFSAPHELFLYIQDDIRDITGDKTLEFHKLRRYAEHRTRIASERNEVTIGEIYDYFIEHSGIDPRHKNDLIEAEFAAELRFCQFRPLGKAMYDYAASQGKRIMVVSDFYYDAASLSRLLTAVGYARINEVYASCDFLESKKEGSLFKKVIIEANIDPHRTLHIGDNHASDIVNAKKYGFRTQWVPRAGETFRKQPIAEQVWGAVMKRAVFPSERAQLGQSLVFGLFAKKLFDQPNCKPRDSFSAGNACDLGYVVLGPLLFAFTQWLIERTAKHRADMLFFLSRDGRLLFRAYSQFAAVDTSLAPAKYILSSRRAYGLAAVKKLADAQELISIPFEPCPLSKIIESRFGVTLNEENCSQELLAAADFTTLDARVHPINDITRLKKLVRLLFPLIEAQAAQERAPLLQYLDDVMFAGASNPAIVDIGYAGTLQSYLCRLSGKQTITGHYFITHAKAAEYRANGMEVAGYLREDIEHHLKRDLISKNISLFELLFSSSEQSLTRFQFADNGASVIAQTKDHLADPRRNLLVDEIQRGALDFVQDMLNCTGLDHQKISLSRDFVALTLERFIDSPHRTDAILFNNLRAEDAFAGRDQRFIVTDIDGTLKKRRTLTKEQARALIGASEWQQGARAILPPPAGSRIATAVRSTSAPAAKAKPLGPISAKVSSSANGVFSRPIRLYRKLRRDPHQYFADSTLPVLRNLKVFFK